MRKIIDLMAVTGFLLSGSMTAALVISYLQFDKFMDESMARFGGPSINSSSLATTCQLSGG